MKLRVLIACERSGVVRRAFRQAGHDAHSADILPAGDKSPFHYTGDVRHLLNLGWDMMIAHPPCTFLTNPQIWTVHRSRTRQKQAADAIQFVRELWEAPIDRVCIENPAGMLNSEFAKPAQQINVSDFGEPYLKRYCFWTRGLLPLRATRRISPDSDRRPYWSKHKQQTAYRSRLQDAQRHSGGKRDHFFPGVAAAMADQWGTTGENQTPEIFDIPQVEISWGRR